MTSGFEETRDTITIIEGGRVSVCVELKGFDQSKLERGIEIGIEAPPSKQKNKQRCAKYYCAHSV